MDNTYNPDKWALANFTFEKENAEEIKVVATWYGGYLDGDSWRFSSGVTKIEEDENFYLFHNNSGSIYKCHKKAEGMGSYTAMIFRNYEKSHKAKVITVEELKEKLKS